MRTLLAVILGVTAFSALYTVAAFIIAMPVPGFILVLLLGGWGLGEYIIFTWENR